MTTTKLTKQEVREALETFRRQGLPRPGLHRLRETIGHGSLARLKRLLQEIDLETVDQLAPETVARLPDPITVAAARVWQELEAASDALQNTIEANLHQAQAVMHDQLQGLRTSLADAESALETADRDNARLTAQLEASETARARLAPELERAQAEAARLRAELGAEERQAAAREAALTNELDAERSARQQDARQAEKRFENLQASLDAARAEVAGLRESHAAATATAQAERAAAERTQQGLEARVEALSEDVDTLRAAKETLQERLDAARADVAKERAAHAASTATHRAEITGGERSRADLERRLTELTAAHEGLQERSRQLKQALARSEASEHAQSTRAAELRNELKTALATMEAWRQTPQADRKPRSK